MSNRARLRGAGKNRDRPQCAGCGHRIGALQGRIVMPDGRCVCNYCRDRGTLSQRLSCGHYGLPGMTIAADSADQSNWQCPQCSPHIPFPATYAGNQTSQPAASSGAGLPSRGAS